MERCELCDQRATMHCESDRASLCWSCDEKVHGANFLVAKHARALLCHVCQSPTPWRASGQKLGPTVSVCEGCLRSHEEKEVVACGRRGEVGRGCIDGDCCSQSGERHDEEDVEVLDSVDEDDDREEDDDDDDDDEDTVDDEVEDEEEDEEEEEDGENQVVPWTFDSPPPVASSSSADEDESVSKTFDLGGGGLRTKRLRQSEDLNSDDEIGCVSSGVSSRILLANEDAATSASFRPTKQRRRVVECERNRSETRRECSGEESNSHNIVNTLKRLHRSVPSDGVAAADDTIAGICRLSGYEGR